MNNTLILFGITFFTIVISLAFFYMFCWKKKDEELTTKKIVKFKEVFEYYKNNGYLTECKKDKYKFSASVLCNIIKKEDDGLMLGLINIDSIEEARTIKGVGFKVFSLINHLVTKYKEENSINI